MEKFLSIFGLLLIGYVVGFLSAVIQWSRMRRKKSIQNKHSTK